MQRNLFTYIWRHSRPEQLVILALVVLGAAVLLPVAHGPKDVINNAFRATPSRITRPFRFLVWEFDLRAFLPGKVIRIFDGFQVDQLQYLVVMSFVFLGAVIVNGQFKKTINTQKGRMGERMLRRLRYELYDRILRFPPAHFRKVKQAELATMVKDEVEPLGGFIGDAFVAPMFLGGQALTAIIFIMMQNWLLGIVVIALLGVQMVIIPRLRKPVLVLGRQAPDLGPAAGRPHRRDPPTASTRSTSTAPPTTSAPTSPTAGRDLQDPFRSLSEEIRRQFWNNFLSQATPFAIYLIGGYFAITGQMDVGAVVACCSPTRTCRRRSRS